MTQPDASPEAQYGAALALLQTQLPVIKKAETAKVETAKGSYSYTYAGLASISEKVLPLLGNLGLSFSARPTFIAEGKFVLLCTLRHSAGFTEEAHYPLPVGGTPQGFGSAVTYGRRYCLCAMTGVSPEEDDDAAAAEAENPAAARRSTAQRANRPAPSAGRGAPARAPAQDAAPAETPPLPGETPDAEPAAGTAQRRPSNAATNPQLQRMAIMFNEIGLKERQDRLDAVTGLLERRIESATELTKREASEVMEVLAEAKKSGGDPIEYLNSRSLAAPGGDPVEDVDPLADPDVPDGDGRPE